MQFYPFVGTTVRPLKARAVIVSKISVIVTIVSEKLEK